MQQDYLRSAMFGCQDGIVSTAGAIVGIAVGTDDHDVVVVAALVVLVVEALSMASGQLVSERAVHQLDPSHRDSVVVGGAVMGVAYLVGGAVPVVPVVAIATSAGVVAGVALSFVALFALGWVKGRLLHVGPLRSGLEVLAIAGLACGAGVVVGLLVSA